MSEPAVDPDFSSLASVCATLSVHDSSNDEVDAIFQEMLILFASKLEVLQSMWVNLEAALHGVSPRPFIARRNPAIIAVAMRLAYQVVLASDNDEGGVFLTTEGMERVRQATEAREVADSTAKAALAGGGALGDLVFQVGTDLSQAMSIVAVALDRFLALLEPADRATTSPHAIQRLLVCLLLGCPLSMAVGAGDGRIKAWRRSMADGVVDSLRASAHGDPSSVDWTLVRTHMSAVTDAIADFVPGGQRQHPYRVAVGPLLAVHHLTVVLPVALQEVANWPVAELAVFSARKPVCVPYGDSVHGDPAQYLEREFEKVKDESSPSLMPRADTEQVATRTGGRPPVDGSHVPPQGGRGQAEMRAVKREPQLQVERPKAQPLGRQQAGPPAGPPKEPARPGLSLPAGRGRPNGGGAPQGTYPLSLPIPLHQEEQPDAGLLENIEEDYPSFSRELSGFSDGPSRRALQQSFTEALGALAEAAGDSKAVSGHQKELLGNHARGVVGARSVFDISLSQGGNHMVSPYTIMGLLLRDGSSKTGDGLNMSLLDSADPARAGIVSLSVRPSGSSGPKRSYQFTLIRRLDQSGRAVMSPMTGPSVRNLFPVAFSQIDVTEQRLLENLRAASREGLLSQKSLEARLRYVGRVFSTVRDLLRPFMHSVTTSDGVFKWYFQRWAAVSVLIIRCLNRPLLPRQMACESADVEPADEPSDPFLGEGFEEYLLQMMGEEATTIRNFLGHSTDHKDKGVGYPIVPALLLSLTCCGICGCAGGVTVAYDGKRVDRNLVHCDVCAPNPTIIEHEALVEAINEKQPFSAPQTPAAPAFGDCMTTMNPLYYSPKAAKPKPGAA